MLFAIILVLVIGMGMVIGGFILNYIYHRRFIRDFDKRFKVKRS